MIVIMCMRDCTLGRPIQNNEKIDQFHSLLTRFRDDPSWVAAHGDNGGLRFAVPMEDGTAIVSVSFMKPKVAKDPTVVEAPDPVPPMPVVMDHGAPQISSSTAADSPTHEGSTTQQTNAVEHESSHLSGYLVLGLPCLMLTPLLTIPILYRIFFMKSRKIGPEGDLTTNSGGREPQSRERSCEDPTMVSVEAIHPSCVLSRQVSQEGCEQN